MRISSRIKYPHVQFPITSTYFLKKKIAEAITTEKNGETCKKVQTSRTPLKLNVSSLQNLTSRQMCNVLGIKPKLMTLHIKWFNDDSLALIKNLRKHKKKVLHK